MNIKKNFTGERALLGEDWPGVERRPSCTPDDISHARAHDVLLVDLSEQIDLGLNSARSTKTGIGSTGTGSTDTVLTAYTSGSETVSDASEYNITINFKGTWTSSLQQVFTKVADRITAMMSPDDGDVQNVTVYGARGKPVAVDDIVITAELKAIDGPGNILGQAGPTALRTDATADPYLPATAIMQFDKADAPYYLAGSLWDEIVLHEMMHSIGFGSIWGYKDLVSGASYIGPSAIAEYNAQVDQDYDSIPLETDGGWGTAGSHWSEDVFDEELMTGYLDDYAGTVPDPLSSMSVASLADLGYELRSPYTGYDPYSYPLA